MVCITRTGSDTNASALIDANEVHKCLQMTAASEIIRTSRAFFIMSSPHGTTAMLHDGGINDTIFAEGAPLTTLDISCLERSIANIFLRARSGHL